MSRNPARTVGKRRIGLNPQSRPMCVVAVRTDEKFLQSDDSIMDKRLAVQRARERSHHAGDIRATRQITRFRLSG